MAEAIGALVGAATVQRGKVKLELPPIVENGNTVQLNVSVEGPMADHVEGIHIFNQKNPQPYVAAFHFGPRAGKAACRCAFALPTRRRSWRSPGSAMAAFGPTAPMSS
jgi:sulfur-oxidizing protein SoxY